MMTNKSNQAQSKIKKTQESNTEHDKNVNNDKEIKSSTENNFTSKPITDHKIVSENKDNSKNSIQNVEKEYTSKNITDHKIVGENKDCSKNSIQVNDFTTDDKTNVCTTELSNTKKIIEDKKKKIL